MKINKTSAALCMINWWFWNYDDLYSSKAYEMYYYKFTCYTIWSKKCYKNSPFYNVFNTILLMSD